MGLNLMPMRLFDFFFEHIHADTLQRIACTRCFAVAAVAPVALGADDGFGSVKGVFETVRNQIRKKCLDRFWYYRVHWINRRRPIH